MDFQIPIPSHSQAVNTHNLPFPSLSLISIPTGLFPFRYTHTAKQ